MTTTAASVAVAATPETSDSIDRSSTHNTQSDMQRETSSVGSQDAEKAAVPPPPPRPATERLHSTVRLNQFTLQFEDPALESAYKAFSHCRKKALWLRSLIPAAAFHILFGLGDCLEHPPDHLLVTIPARVFLAMLQIAMFVLVRWDLVLASERTMLLVSICNGIPTLLLYALQRSSLHQWDALFVVFGLSFYTIPKITPLGFVASLLGSWFTAILYAVLSFLVLPPTRPFESLLGFMYCAPVIGIFNTISYYSEYNSRERFVLRRRLRSESITLAVSRTSALPVSSLSSSGSGSLFSLDGSSSNGGFFFISNKFASGVLLWAAFTMGGWTSLPEMLKFVDEDTGWAWFSHCAGVAMFLVVMTRQLQWLFVVPVLGAFVLYMLTLAMPASWIIVSAHSVGYGLLLASIVVAMGVFSRFVFVWRELVSFLTRSCFLYPQLQAGLQDEFPLLVKIVSEYTAGMDPEIMSSRDSNSRAAALTTHSTTAPLAKTAVVGIHHGSSNTTSTATAFHTSRTSPRRRQLTASTSATAAVAKTLPALTASSACKSNQHHSNNKTSHTDTRLLHVEPHSYEEEDGEAAEHDQELLANGELQNENCSSNKMVSMLPSFKAGKCFFCSKNEAEHFVPACGMWGKWTHWRMSQQHDILFGSLALPGASGSSGMGGGGGGSGGVVGKPVASMCTSYYDVQQQKSELEQQVEQLVSENEKLRSDLAAHGQQIQTATAERVHLQAELRTLEEKRGLDLQRQEATLQRKVDQVLAESNHVAHTHKLQLRELETQNKKLAKDLEEMRGVADSAKQQRQRAVREARELQEQENQELRDQVARLQQELQALKSAGAGSTATMMTTTTTATTNEAATGSLTTLQPSRRLPYARWIEIEGLRESIGKKHDGDNDSDRRQPWAASGF